MTRPLRLDTQTVVPRSLRTRIYPHRSATILIGLADLYLQLHPALLADHERRLQRQLTHTPTFDLATSTQRKLQQRRARQQHITHDHMVSKPRMRLQRDPSRKQPTIIPSHRNRCPQQRMLSRPKPSGREVPRAPFDRLQPIALALE